MNALPLETYRHQLAESADHVCAAIARAALTGEPLELECLAMQLQGVARFALQWRSAIHDKVPQSVMPGAQV